MKGDAVHQVVHQVVLGLSFDGYHATCTCGWRSETSWSRDDVARERGLHKRRSQLRSVP